MKEKFKKIIILFLILIIVVTLTIVITLKLSKNNSEKIGENKKEVVYIEKSKKVEDIKKYENIVFLGDSITDFYPVDSIFSELPIIKSGISGFTTKDILDRMEVMVYRYNPTSIYTLIGTNDIMVDDEGNKKEAVKNIKKIIKEIQENRAQAKIYLESIYPINKSIDSKMVRDRQNDDIREMNKELKEYCEEKNVTYIDMYNELSDSEGNFEEKYTNDGLHPNDLGYAKISQIRSLYIYGIER